MSTLSEATQPFAPVGYPQTAPKGKRRRRLSVVAAGAAVAVIGLGVGLGVAAVSGDDTAAFQQGFRQIITSADAADCSTALGSYTFDGSSDAPCNSMVMRFGGLAQQTDLNDEAAQNSIQAARAAYNRYESYGCFGVESSECITEATAVLSDLDNAYQASGGKLPAQ